MIQQSNNQQQRKIIKGTYKKLLPPSENIYICCFSEKWCFKHQGLPINNDYDENFCLCFKIFDCCTWCFEFKQKKTCLCPKSTVCFMCCCSITFD